MPLSESQLDVLPVGGFLCVPGNCAALALPVDPLYDLSTILQLKHGQMGPV